MSDRTLGPRSHHDRRVDCRDVGGGSYLEANDFAQARHAAEAATELAVRAGDPWVRAQTEAGAELVDRAGVGT